MALNNKKDEKDLDQKTKENILLTEEEFERKQRLKTKERINQTTRVFGLIAIIILVYAGIFDILFEFTFFGFLFDKKGFNQVWSIVDVDGLDYAPTKIFDDPMKWGTWLPQLGMTILFIAVSILMIYFLTYTIADIVSLIKSMFFMGKDLTKDLSGNLETTLQLKKIEKKKSVKKNLFKDESLVSEKTLKEKKEPAKKKEKVERRSEENSGYEGLSEEQLDALLSGKSLEEVAPEMVKKDEEVYEIKPLFDD